MSKSSLNRSPRSTRRSSALSLRSTRLREVAQVECPRRPLRSPSTRPPCLPTHLDYWLRARRPLDRPAVKARLPRPLELLQTSRSTRDIEIHLQLPVQSVEPVCPASRSAVPFRTECWQARSNPIPTSFRNPQAFLVYRSIAIQAIIEAINSLDQWSSDKRATRQSCQSSSLDPRGRIGQTS